MISSPNSKLKQENMSEENQIIEDVEEKDLVENQELVQDNPEEVAEDTSQTLTQAVVDALLGEAKKNESEDESDEDDDDDSEEEEEVEEAKSTSKKEESDEDDSEEDEEEVEEATTKTEEEESDEDDSVENKDDKDEDDDDSVEEIKLPDVKTKAGYLAASFDALKSMKKSQLVNAYKGINVSEDGGEVEVPKTKADIINAMYGQLKTMQKEQLTASYKAIQDSCGDVHEELEIESYVEDLKILADSEQELTESFKAKVGTLFEGAVANRVVEIKESLEAQYDNDLQEEVGYIRESLVTKIDDYLSYVVESWIGENQEFVDNKLRTEIAENFMKALQGVFTEHYIEVPDSKVDLVDQLSDEVTSVKESLAGVRGKNLILTEEVESLHREKILSEATADLASTQVAKLSSIIEEVDFVDADTFASKVATIKEGFFSNSDSSKEEVITESIDSSNVKTIVEGELDPSSNLSGDMKRYVSTLSRFK
tara:strand:- start:2016 stop:3464 length:1449 start_codon:yes stop_codon:yes gene_type:complete